MGETNQLTVRCTVANCYFWDQGNVCGAKEILVTSDNVATSYSDSIDAQQLSMILEEVGETPTGSCEQTCCKTFRHK